MNTPVNKFDSMHPNERQMLEGSRPLPTALSLVRGIGETSLRHYVWSQHIEFISFGPEVAYPNPGDVSGPGAALFLSPGDISGSNDRYLRLPASYISFGEALNDATGTASGQSSQQIVKKLFNNAGASIDSLIRYSGLFPENLSYKQMILDRDTSTIKLLPPVLLKEVSETNDNPARLVYKSLVNSLEATFMNRNQNEQVNKAKSTLRIALNLEDE